jgi:hypothetical protein
VAQPNPLAPEAAPAPAQPDRAEQEKPITPLLELKPVKVNKDDSEMQKLLKERYNQALLGLAARHQEFQAGRGTLEVLQDAAKRLVKAGLELKEEPKDQVALLSGYIDVLKGIENAVEMRVQSGRAPMADLCEVRYNRLDAAIDLLRLKKKVALPRRAQGQQAPAK